MENKERERTYQKILDYVIRFKKEKGYSPVFREIAEGIGFKSSATVFEYLRDMKQLNLIDYQDESPRTITVPGYRYVKVGKGHG